MGTLISQTRYDVLPPGTYRVKLAAVAVEDGIYGPQVVLRFDVLDEELVGRSIKAWAAAKLSGGRRPSKLYSWTSALLFGGRPLPDDYDLDTDALRNREALAVVEVIEREGVLYNRVAQLFPLRAAAAPAVGPAFASAPKVTGSSTVAASPEGEGWLNGPGSAEIFDPENHGIFDEEPPW